MNAAAYQQLTKKHEHQGQPLLELILTLQNAIKAAIDDHKKVDHNSGRNA